MVSKHWWVSFVKWNGGEFWTSEKHVKKNFLVPAEKYLEDRTLAHAKLDMTSKGEREKGSYQKHLRKRRKQKKNIGERYENLAKWKRR